MKKAIGIDIGGTSTKLALVLQDGRIISHTEISTDQEQGFDHFIQRLVQSIKILSPNERDIIGIGIGAPNANAYTGQLDNPPNLSHWGSPYIIHELRKHTQLPITLDNDANIAAIEEKLWGQAKDEAHFIVVTMGTGIGTGIMSHGQILRGSNGLAGEGGHIKVGFTQRPCKCGQTDHLESYVSCPGIEKSVSLELGRFIPFKEIVTLYHLKDPQIVNVINSTANYLALGLEKMISVLAPTSVIISGGGSHLGQNFIDMTQKCLDECIYPNFKSLTRIKLSQLEKICGAALGASALAFTKKLKE